MRLLALHQVHAQVVALDAHKLRITAVTCSCGHKYRRRVAWTKGLEIVQVTLELICDVREQQLAIDVHLGNKDVGVDILLNIVVEALGEGRNILLLHRETRSVHMSAEVLQQVGARLHSLV